MRYGKIVVTNAFRQCGELWKMFNAIEFTPLYIDNNIIYGSTVYYGTSSRFDDIKVGEFTPGYDVSINEENEATVYRNPS